MPKKSANAQPERTTNETGAAQIEFWAMLMLIIAVLIAAAYILSRGHAMAGTDHGTAHAAKPVTTSRRTTRPVPPGGAAAQAET